MRLLKLGGKFPPPLPFLNPPPTAVFQSAQQLETHMQRREPDIAYPDDALCQTHLSATGQLLLKVTVFFHLPSLVLAPPGK